MGASSSIFKRLLPVAGIVLTASLAFVPLAHGELVGEFNARIKNIKLDYGGYTAVFESRVYDTTGAPPPMLQQANIRFPRGASIRPQFLRGKYMCDTARLELTADPAVCKDSEFATGGVLLDARPDIPDAIPSDLDLFLGAPRTPGAIASVAVLVVSNQRTPVYASQTLYGALYPDSGQFGYRLELPTTITPLIPGLRLSLAELNLTVPGLTTTKRVKVRTKRGTKTRQQKVFWTKVPKCTAKKQVTFAADYQFQTAAPISKQKTIKCTRFLRQPSTNGKGGIPGT